MYSITINESSENSLSVGILIKGELILENSKAIIGELTPLLSKYNNFTFNIDQVDDIDLSFLQTLKALETEIGKQNKKFEKKITLPETFYELFTNTGLSYFVS